MGPPGHPPLLSLCFSVVLGFLTFYWFSLIFLGLFTCWLELCSFFAILGRQLCSLFSKLTKFNSRVLEPCNRMAIKTRYPNKRISHPQRDNSIESQAKGQIAQIAPRLHQTAHKTQMHTPTTTQAGPPRIVVPGRSAQFANPPVGSLHAAAKRNDKPTADPARTEAIEATAT